METKIRTGCSSWTSEAWWERVYPRSTKPGERLRRYAQLYDTVEVDSSYYRDPGPVLTRQWAQKTPAGFLFSLKFPRDFLDPKRPVATEEIARFFTHVTPLGEKLGPVLLQFPPWVKPGKVRTFLSDLLETLDPTLRYAVEMRDSGWFQGEPFEGLKKELADHNIALTWSYLTYVEVPPELTSDFIYLRFVGDHRTVPAEIHGEVRVDRSAEMRLWGERVKRAEPRGHLAYVYFNNHFQGFAPASLNAFRKEVGLEPVDYSPGTGSPPTTSQTLEGAMRGHEAGRSGIS